MISKRFLTGVVIGGVGAIYLLRTLKNSDKENIAVKPADKLDYFNLED
ncbi:MAG: hypothetical protein ACQEQI_00805 [Bacillota bacterium]